MDVSDVDGTRALAVDSISSQTSVFLAGPQGWCMEFDRSTFVVAMAEEFGLVPAGLLRAFAPVGE